VGIVDATLDVLFLCEKAFELGVCFLDEWCNFDFGVGNLGAGARHDLAADLRLARCFANGQLDKTSELRKARRRIARLNTLIRQREIAAAGAGE
jgi:ribosomal protein L29